MNPDDLPKPVPDNSELPLSSPVNVQTNDPIVTTPAGPISTDTLRFTELFDQIAEKIIAQQEQIIGPVAVQQARQVDGITVDWGNNHTVTLEGNGKEILDDLINQYRELFGQIAVEVSKEAAAKLASGLTPDQLPELLK